MKRPETTIAEIKDDATYFGITLFGIAMILIGNQLQVLNGWLFWFPLGILVLPCIRNGIELLASLRKKVV
jgi:hypothetical protein